MEDSYYIQEESLGADSDDGFEYDEVSVGDAGDLSSGEEDLTSALENVKASIKSPMEQSSDSQIEPSSVSARPEVVEDFVRNYLMQNGLLETAESFQREWYELSQRGKLKSYQTQLLPEVYVQNRQLESTLSDVTSELNRYKEAARLAKERYVRVQKERDYHRMHHRRVIQEKNKVLSDIKRMKDHYSTYQPVMQELHLKYQTVTKEKMLACLERDRAVSEVGCLQSTLQSVQHGESRAAIDSHRGLHQATTIEQPPKTKSVPNSFPNEPSNPFRNMQLPVCAHLTRTAGFQPCSSFPAHDYAVSCLALHPTKPLLVTGSDDHSWKMWSMPSGELLLSGEGHLDWLSAIQFHPEGSQLASTSGDGLVKLWDFDKACCITTFTEHQQPVWDCSWHWAGIHLVSGGMDHTAKVWDVNMCTCVSTLRGHSDSINALSFIPFSNILVTASADKTVSLWDIRTGFCEQTYYGHSHCCNAIYTTLQGYELFSCDCLGCLIQWDIRSQASSKRKWDLGPYSINKLSVDPAGALVFCACDDGNIMVVDPTTADKEWCLTSEGGRVQDVLITRQADMLLSAHQNGAVTVWQ